MAPKQNPFMASGNPGGPFGGGVPMPTSLPQVSGGAFKVPQPTPGVGKKKLSPRQVAALKAKGKK